MAITRPAMLRMWLTLGLLLAASLLARAGDSGPVDAYATVKTAERFSVGGVGFAGTLSEAETALRLLLKQPEAVIRCKKLLTEATPAGQFYALFGLRLLDEQAFRAALPHYSKSREEIPTMSGCIVMKTPAAALARRIEKGELK